MCHKNGLGWLRVETVASINWRELCARLASTLQTDYEPGNPTGDPLSALAIVSIRPPDPLCACFFFVYLMHDLTKFCYLHCERNCLWWVDHASSLRLFCLSCNEVVGLWYWETSFEHRFLKLANLCLTLIAYHCHKAKIIEMAKTMKWAATMYQE